MPFRSRHEQFNRSSWQFSQSFEYSRNRRIDKASWSWAYGKEKIRGAERNLPDFSDCARPLPKIFFSEQINFGDPPPPSPKKFRSVYHFRGQKKFSGTIICQYCPTFKRILHDYLYLNNKLRAFWLLGFFISLFLPDLCWIFARLFDFVIFWGGQLPPLPPRPVRLWSWCMVHGTQRNI
jgi:hypothetical protein